MTAQPPVLHGSRKVTFLGWGAVVLVVILLSALTTALFSGYGAAQGDGGAAPSSTPIAAPSGTATPSAAPPAPPVSAQNPATDAPVSAPEGPALPAAPVEQAPVALTEAAMAVPQVVVTLGSLEAVDGLAQGPGEVAGPALRFTVTVRNGTDASVSLASTVVNVYAGLDQTPSIDLAEPGGVPLPDEVKPGQSATGTFVFAVPQESRGVVKISVDYSAGVPVVVFQGPAPA
ncbi:hypothetical protein [Cryobacterium sp. MLB-32]|uniref:hypothetical protein n=1 Tax=Cryobacterium sp. MLB-32 TaxID=1529318 RepID=UPI000689E021|nr:hypothetical protein [Cryobacterium sp. MLB-32]